VFNHEPCKSGSPHGVLHFFAAAAFDAPGALLASGVCATAGTETSRPVTNSIIGTSANTRIRSLIILNLHSIDHEPLFVNLLSKVPVDKFFCEVYTPELHELSALIQTAIQWKAYLPGPRKHL
jgi:hypothetical protein